MMATIAATELMTIEELSDTYLLCRSLGHAWDELPNPEFSPTMFRLHQHAIGLRCIRCLTERYDYIGQDMKVALRHYKYPAHYRTIPGQSTRPNVRGEMLRRSLLIRTYGNNREGPPRLRQVGRRRNRR